jgi:ribokinase
LDKHGSMIAAGNSVLEVEATNDQVIDATGAGDAFCGSFLGHYLRSQDARAAAELATQTAGWVVSRFGARAAMDDEIRARVARFGLKAG